MKEAINKIEVLGAKDEPLCKNDRHRLRDVEALLDGSSNICAGQHQSFSRVDRAADPKGELILVSLIQSLFTSALSWLAASDNLARRNSRIPTCFCES